MSNTTYTAFLRTEFAARGTEAEIAAALQGLGPHPEGLLVFADATGAQVDLNLTGAPVDSRPPRGHHPSGSRPAGRPKLGVTAREVTLLPRHWDWLRRQRGGASAALRRLVDAAMEAAPPANPDAAYAFVTAMAGDLANYEAAIRALYAGDAATFGAAMQSWPADIRAHAVALARL
ncbi:MAG: DUF2239 family protein [Maritimibacter sp.]|nr:DUF2239 family protein [Maritimibacter sp.]